MKEPKHISIDDKLNVKYCIDSWLRDEQVKAALARPYLGRLPDQQPVREEPIAIACFGPSLADTWEKIKSFKYIMTCSGSHKFLLDRDIIPSYHVEVDPRAHKVELQGTPHHDVEYLIASACHPRVFEHLKDYNVTLWHVFSNEEEALRILPRGEWAITGGSSVGLRCMTLARWYGFTNLHIFGMDGSFGSTGKHAAEHPNQPKGHCLVDYNGVTYETTPAVLLCAKETFHELNQLKDCTAKFYGKGLVQEMAKDYVPKPPDGKVSIGAAHPELISAEYAKLNEQLHKENMFYGVGGGKYAETVLKLKEAIKADSILDYGCGKSYLAKALPFAIWEYDPAIKGKEESPRPADIVISTDVLEHIEPERLLFVLDDLRRCVRKIGYFVISTIPAGKFLADGRNTHLIVHGQNWWSTKLSKFFTIGKIWMAGSNLHVIVGVKAITAKKEMVA